MASEPSKTKRSALDVLKEHSLRVLAFVQRWYDRLEIDPEKHSLRGLLSTINVVLVLLVIVGISASAVGLLRSLANTQGMTRVQLAGTSAREELRKMGEDVLTQTRGLARNDVLRRALLESSEDTLAALLKRSCSAANLSACALVQGDQVMVETTGSLQWNGLLIAAREQGERFLNVESSTQPPAMGASAAVVAVPQAPQQTIRLLGVRYLDDKLAHNLSERVGVTIQLVNYRGFSSAPVDVFTRLHTTALSDGRYAAERINAKEMFAASVPVLAGTGEPIALILSEIKTDDTDATVGSLTRRLLITAIVVGALAVAASLLLGQLVAQPLRNLTDAAARLGQGDFSTSIPTSGPAEVGVLARTMEDMRRNLVDLTGTLRRRDAEAQAVLGGTSEGVYAVDKSRRLTYLNPQGARMLGIHADDAIGRFCGDVLKPCLDANGRPPCDTHCPIVAARSSTSAQASERLRIANGTMKTAVITSAAPVDGLQVQIMRDETELEAIRRARDSVLANISHEFRTPLAAQLAGIELLLDGLDTLPPPQLRELALSLERGTQRLTNLIDNLLESVRIEAGQLGIRHQSVALGEVVAEAQSLVGALLEQRGQTLQVEIDDGLPHVEGDETRLTQVFVNLIANASKFAPEHTTVRVGAEVQGEHVIAWVEDEGPGVPEQHQQSIFERFSRGPEHEPEPGGLGLGLWIVKSIVERHGGTVTATRTPQQRTRFSFNLQVMR